MWYSGMRHGAVRYRNVQCCCCLAKHSWSHVVTGTSTPLRSLAELQLIDIRARPHLPEGSELAYIVSAQVVLGADNALCKTRWLTETDMFAKTLVSSCCNHPVVAPAEEVCSSPGLSRRKKNRIT